MFRRADGTLLVVAAVIACVPFCHARQALVREPPWLLSLVASLLIGVVVFRIKSGQTQLGWSGAGLCLALGLVAALSIPKTSPPPAHISTHAAAAGLGAAHTDLLTALQVLDDDPASMLGHRISVHGLWSPRAIPASASVWVQIMACCAADAIDVGFDVVPRHNAKIALGAPVHVTGIVRADMRDGELRYRLDDAIVTTAAPPTRAPR
jgi:hypothetical protein